MSPFTRESYRGIASALTPPAVSQYLASQHWHLEARQENIKEIWRLPAGDGLRGRIMLPLATDYADFPQRFNDALFALGRIHGWDAIQLQEKIIATRADLFFVRLDQAMQDGTIPFRQAEKTIDAIYKLLRSAATTAAAPHHSHLGRRPAAVSEFLEEDVRLGHTKQGSFVFTVVSRLGDPVPAQAAPVPQTAITPFPRKVMETLAQGLETTQRLARVWDPHVLDAPGQLGLSAALVESLEEIAEPEALRSVELSFAWAAAEPRPAVGADIIVVDRDMMTALPRVRERLVRQEEPPHREILVGMVRSLTREDSNPDAEEAGTVVVSADVRGKARSIHMTLTGEDHDWAIFAYRQKLPFTVSAGLGASAAISRWTQASCGTTPPDKGTAASEGPPTGLASSATRCGAA